jgi:GNAT superfamily N-acetyltransferase
VTLTFLSVMLVPEKPMKAPTMSRGKVCSIGLWERHVSVDRSVTDNRERLYSVVPFDKRKASLRQWSECAALQRQLLAEGARAEAVSVTEKTVEQYRRELPDDHACWIACDQRGSVVALAILARRSPANLWIGVAPIFRRQGIATILLRHAAKTVRDYGAEHLAVITKSNVPSGELFVTRFEGRRIQTICVHELDVVNIATDVMKAWKRAGTATGISLTTFKGPYDAATVPAIATLRCIVGEVYGALPVSVEEEASTIHHEDIAFDLAGIERWTAIARCSTRVVGFSEAIWSSSRPTFLAQRQTAVLPQCRGQGVGLWLNATILENVLSVHPEINRVRTVNLTTACGMIRRNQELGFDSHHETTWELSARVLAENAR